VKHPGKEIPSINHLSLAAIGVVVEESPELVQAIRWSCDVEGDWKVVAQPMA
jgi:hypothetical protein